MARSQLSKRNLHIPFSDKTLNLLYNKLIDHDESLDQLVALNGGALQGELATAIGGPLGLLTPVVDGAVSPAVLSPSGLLVIPITVPNAASSLLAFVNGPKIEIVDVVVISTATGAGNTVQVQTAAGAANISDAISCATATDVARAAIINTANSVLAAGAGFTINTVRAAGSLGARVLIHCIPR